MWNPALHTVMSSLPDSLCFRFYSSMARLSFALPCSKAREDTCSELNSSLTSASGGVLGFLCSIRPNTDAVRQYGELKTKMTTDFDQSIYLILSAVTSKRFFKIFTHSAISALDDELYECGIAASSLSSSCQTCVSLSYTPNPFPLIFSKTPLIMLEQFPCIVQV